MGRILVKIIWAVYWPLPTFQLCCRVNQTGPDRRFWPLSTPTELLHARPARAPARGKAGPWARGLATPGLPESGGQRGRPRGRGGRSWARAWTTKAAAATRVGAAGRGPGHRRAVKGRGPQVVTRGGLVIALGPFALIFGSSRKGVPPYGARPECYGRRPLPGRGCWPRARRRNWRDPASLHDARCQFFRLNNLRGAHRVKLWHVSSDERHPFQIQIIPLNGSQLWPLRDRCPSVLMIKARWRAPWFKHQVVHRVNGCIIINRNPPIRGQKNAILRVKKVKLRLLLVRGHGRRLMRVQPLKAPGLCSQKPPEIAREPSSSWILTAISAPF